MLNITSTTCNLMHRNDFKCKLFWILAEVLVPKQNPVAPAVWSVVDEKLSDRMSSGYNKCCLLHNKRTVR